MAPTSFQPMTRDITCLGPWSDACGWRGTSGCQEPGHVGNTHLFTFLNEKKKKSEVPACLMHFILLFILKFLGFFWLVTAAHLWSAIPNYRVEKFMVNIWVTQHVCTYASICNFLPLGKQMWQMRRSYWGCALDFFPSVRGICQPPCLVSGKPEHGNQQPGR